MTVGIALQGCGGSDTELMVEGTGKAENGEELPGSGGSVGVVAGSAHLTSQELSKYIDQADDPSMATMVPGDVVAPFAGASLGRSALHLLLRTFDLIFISTFPNDNSHLVRCQNAIQAMEKIREVGNLEIGRLKAVADEYRASNFPNEVERQERIIKQTQASIERAEKRKAEVCGG